MILAGIHTPTLSKTENDINLHGLSNKTAAQTVLCELAAKYANRSVTKRLQFELASVQSQAGSGKTELQAFEQDREVVSEAERVQERDEIQLSAYPNPFNPETTIEFTLPQSEVVTVRIFNALGQEVRTLVHGEKLAADAHTYRWDSRNESGHRVPSGTYYLQVQAGDVQKINKLSLVK